MIRSAVIGTGGWGKNHLRVLNELNSLKAFVEIDSSKRKSYEKLYSVTGYENVDLLLSNEEIEAVTVCTPTSTHYDVAKKFLTHGIATLVEKPLTYKSAQGEELVQIAKDNDSILTVGFIERFNPAIEGVKKVLKEKTLGDPLLIEFRRENRWAGVVKDVGVILDSSVHDIDTARWIFHDEPKIVFARKGKVITEHEDFATIVLGFDHQRTAFLISNWVTPKKKRTISITCTGGNVTADYLTQEVMIDDGNSILIPKRPFEEPLLKELTAFVDAVENKRQPLVTGMDGLNTTKIAEAALNSGERGVPIYLNL